MSTEENKALILRLYEEVWNKHNPEAADDFVAADVFSRDMLPEYQHGVDGYKHLVRWLHTAMPNLRMDIEDMIAEGDKVVMRFRGSGTHEGETEAFGPPTGKRMEITGITIKRLADGKIVEAWTNFDALGMMQQLGVMAAQQPAEA